eukprot:TRINITY_DN10010_c0_g1_i2.p1 TRINITY_DN10010_c0_g1~~TRINITY_DN10010_c0_g1_i2.p1  ORF type:complete len:486 (+),score=155.27 TRINITY_DN10010_c0_g1_i2:57-1460(+)
MRPGPAPPELDRRPPHRMLWPLPAFAALSALYLLGRSGADSRAAPGLHVAVYSLEFVPPLFSGNGLYSRTLVKGLLLPEFAGAIRKVSVVCACPADGDCADDDAVLAEHARAGRLEVHRVKVPAALWRRLDRQAPWSEYSAGAALPKGVDVAMLIDWHSLPAYGRHGAATPCVSLSFRVYFASPGLADDPEDAAFFANFERSALPEMGTCGAAIALTDNDRQLLQKLCRGPAETREKCAGRIAVLPPALRPDIAAEAGSRQQSQRRYLVSCVRLSPEKRAHVFADAVARLGAGFLSQHGVVPVICGAHANKTYAASVVQSLRAVAPDAVVEPDFLGAQRLGDLFSAALLNVHPPLYDAYGMTVLEAAAFGAPTLLHRPRAGAHSDTNLAEGIGATMLADPDRGEAVGTDFGDVDAVAAAMRRLLGTPEGRAELTATGARARQRALGWTDRKATERLVRVLQKEAKGG